MDSRIESVLETAFPDREVDDVGATGPSWNDDNRTVAVDFADGDRERVYLKLALDGDGSRVARERAVLAFVGANCEIPVPTVLASDPDTEAPYLVTEPVPGTNLLDLWSAADDAERASLARRVGRALASVHALRFDAPGHVVGGGADDLELETKPWTDVLVETIARMRARASSDRFDHHFDEVLAAVEANRGLLEDAPAALLHGDPARPNCFRGESGIGFLDWELAHVGDPVRDLYRTRDQQFGSLRDDGPERLVAAFHEGYRDRAGGLPAGAEERRPVYEAVRFLGRSGFFDKWAEFVDESPEELDSWMREEMARRLAEL